MDGDLVLEGGLDDDPRRVHTGIGDDDHANLILTACQNQPDALNGNRAVRMKWDAKR